MDPIQDLAELRKKAMLYVTLRNLLSGVSHACTQFTVAMGFRNAEKMKYNNLKNFVTTFKDGMVPMTTSHEKKKELKEYNGDFSAILVQLSAFLATLNKDEIDNFINDLDTLCDKYTEIK